MSIKKDEPLRVQLGKKIKEYRLARRLTQAELGKRVGVSYTQVQKYENGSNYISAGRLYGLAVALSIDVISFFTDIPSDQELNETSSDDGEILALIRKYSKIKSKRSRRIVYLLVKSFSQG